MTDAHRIRSTAALLASDNDGEALGAARALCRLLGNMAWSLPALSALGWSGAWRNQKLTRDLRQSASFVRISSPLACASPTLIC